MGLKQGPRVKWQYKARALKGKIKIGEEKKKKNLEAINAKATKSWWRACRLSNEKSYTSHSRMA